MFLCCYKFRYIERRYFAPTRRNPSQTVLYRVIADHLETFLASLDADPDAKGLPAYVPTLTPASTFWQVSGEGFD